MISLLFEYYKLYKTIGLVTPQSLLSYTNSYFSNKSIKGWIEENMEQKEKCYIQVKEISTLYAEAIDKTLSVKQLKEELEGSGYTVTKCRI